MSEAPMDETIYYRHAEAAFRRRLLGRAKGGKGRRPEEARPEGRDQAAPVNRHHSLPPLRSAAPVSGSPA